mgnify:CR=1 FL=1
MQMFINFVIVKKNALQSYKIMFWENSVRGTEFKARENKIWGKESKKWKRMLLHLWLHRWFSSRSWRKKRHYCAAIYSSNTWGNFINQMAYRTRYTLWKYLPIRSSIKNMPCYQSDFYRWWRSSNLLRKN